MGVMGKTEACALPRSLAGLEHVVGVLSIMAMSEIPTRWKRTPKRRLGTALQCQAIPMSTFESSLRLRTYIYIYIRLPTSF